MNHCSTLLTTNIFETELQDEMAITVNTDIR